VALMQQSAREHDYLNRWPFAQEIYGIATTGPRGWSVRIGVYGEWGTGKTTVLNFVRVMAKPDGHVVVAFNPWQFRSTDDLWREFVRTIYRHLQDAAGGKLGGNLGRRAKLLSVPSMGSPDFCRTLQGCGI